MKVIPVNDHVFVAQAARDDYEARGELLVPAESGDTSFMHRGRVIAVGELSEGKPKIEVDDVVVLSAIGATGLAIAGTLKVGDNEYTQVTLVPVDQVAAILEGGTVRDETVTLSGKIIVPDSKIN